MQTSNDFHCTLHASLTTSWTKPWTSGGSSGAGDFFQGAECGKGQLPTAHCVHTCHLIQECYTWYSSGHNDQSYCPCHHTGGFLGYLFRITNPVVSQIVCFAPTVPWNVFLPKVGLPETRGSMKGWRSSSWSIWARDLWWFIVGFNT